MLNRQAIEVAVKLMARDGSRPAHYSSADAAHVLAAIAGTGFAKGYRWTRSPAAWREVAARYARKEVTLAGLKGLQLP